MNGEIFDAAKKEPPPEINTKPFIQELVIRDIEDRMAYGKAKYGTLLQPFNGRNSLMDCYQELLDAVVYMRQRLYEEIGA